MYHLFIIFLYLYLLKYFCPQFCFYFSFHLSYISPETVFVHAGVCYLLFPMLKTYLYVVGPVFGCMCVVRATDFIAVIKTLDNMSELCPPMYYAFHNHANVVYISSRTYTFLIARPLSLASLGGRQDLDSAISLVILTVSFGTCVLYITICRQ